MTKKKISIIMNCFNGEKFLNESINSLLNQTHKNWELIFFDNNSTDKSAKIVKKLNDKRIKYYRTNNKIKLGLARKKAIDKASGEFIAFLDTDDIWEKNKLTLQLKTFKDKKVGFSITNSIFFNEKTKKLFSPFSSSFNRKVFYELIENYFISFETVIIRKSFLKKLDHSIDYQFNIIHDMDLLIRLSEICEMSYLPLALSKWRMRDKSLSFNSFNIIIKEKKILIKKLEKMKKNDLYFEKSKKKYMDILYRQNILLLLSKKKMLQTIKLIQKLQINLKNLILIMLILFPFKKYIFKNIFNLKY